MKDNRASLGEEIGPRLIEAGSERPLVLVDLSKSTVQDERDKIEGAFGEAGQQVFFVQDSLLGALNEWLDAVETRGMSVSRAEEIFDFLTLVSRGEVGESEGTVVGLFADGVVRLMEELSAVLPATLMILGPDGLSEAEWTAVQEACQHFFADPLGRLDPGVAKQSGVGICVRGDVDLGVEVRRVEFDQRLRANLQSFLEEDRVVEQLLAATGGDRVRLEALLEGLPPSVDELWRARFRSLGADAREVLALLAVAGRALDLAVLEEATPGPVLPSLRELQGSGLLERRVMRGAVEVDCAREEIRRGVLEELGEEERIARHAALARGALAAGVGDAVFLARHALAAGEVATARRFAVPAAERLFRGGHWTEAEELLNGLRENDPSRDVLELSLQVAEARGRWEQALGLATMLMEGVGESSERGRLEQRIGRCFVELGDFEAALTHLERARTFLDRPEDREDRRQVSVTRAELAFRQGDRELATRLATEVLVADAEREVLDSTAVRARSVLGRVALFGGELVSARRLFEEAASEARRAGLKVEELRAQGNLAVVALQQRRFDEAEQRLGRALEGSPLPGGLPREICWLNLGIVAQRRGELERSLGLYEKTLREVQRRSNPLLEEVVFHNLATLYQDVGAFEIARQLAEDSLKRSETEPGYRGSWARVVLAQILVEQGRLDESLEPLRDAEADGLYSAEMKVRRAAVLLDLGRAEEAQDLVGEVSAEEGTPVVGALRRLVCERLDVLGGEEVKEERWRELFDSLRDAGHFRDALGAKLVLAALWDDEGARSLLLEQALAEVQAREAEVPERFRAQFWQIPVYRRLVEAVNGSLVVEPEVVEAPDLGEAVNEDELDWRQSPGYPRWRKRYAKIVGEDRRLLEALRRVDRVAPGETAVLITGESGTGKELIAEAIHEQSGRSDGPFVKVNCAAFVEELLLSELFGHEKGAFTGAVSEKSGRFERAHGGTIFLDEIGDISPKTQVALLRVLQDGVFERVGGTKTRSADVRVVAATNRPLEEMVESGKFRLDLYYRLKGFVLEMPPLRDRREDVPALLRHFAELSAGDSAPRFAPEVSQYLARYSWPGNIRELENFVRSVLLFVEGDEVTMEHLGQFRDFFSGEHRADLPEISVEIPLDELEIDEPVAVGSLSEDALVDEVLSEELSLSEMKDRLERLCIERALRSTGGNITRAAEKLQMKRPRLSQIINGTPELLALKEELVG